MHSVQNINPGRVTALLLAVLLAPLGCGISGTGSPNPDLAGIEGTGISNGNVSGFGSIWVNGFEIATDEASVLVDGIPTTEAGLEVGQPVSVRLRYVSAASAADATALEIETRSLLDCTVAQMLGLDSGGLSCLQQAVRFGITTVFVGAEDGEAISSGDRVRIHGFVGPSGDYLATRVERLAASSNTVLIEGEVTAVQADRFNIGALQVTPPPMAGTAVQPGDRVRVNGILLGGTPLPDNRIAAQQVEVLPAPVLQRGDIVVAEGLVRGFDGERDLLLGQLPVRLGNAADHSLVPQELADGLLLRIIGRVRNGRVLVSREALGSAMQAVLPVQGLSLVAEVAAIGSGSLELSIGEPIEVPDDVIFVDDSGADQRPFGLADLGLGDRLELRAAVVGLDSREPRLTARFLRRLPPEQAEQRMSGPVLASRFEPAAGETHFDVGVVRVHTQAGFSQYRDAAGRPLAEALFYCTLEQALPGEALVDVVANAETGDGEPLAEQVQLQAAVAAPEACPR